MIFQNISLGEHEKKTNLNLKFQRGTGAFQHVYFAIGDQKLYQDLYEGLSFSLLSDHSITEFQYANLHFNDEAGNKYELKRHLDQCVIMKNHQPTSLTIEPLLREIFATDPDLEKNTSNTLAIGRYHLSKKNGNFYTTPLSKKNEDEQIVYKFINSHIEKILEGCVFSLESSSYGNLPLIRELCSQLIPIHKNYNTLLENKKNISKSRTTEPRDTRLEINVLKKQIDLMHEIKSTTLELTQANPKLDDLKQDLTNIESQIQKNLDFCQLDAIPKKPSPPDWNVPLQCLCYLNVLEKMIPVLTQSLMQFRKHFKQSINQLENENKEFASLKTELLGKLNACKKNLYTNLHATYSKQKSKHKFTNLMSIFSKNNDKRIAQEIVNVQKYFDNIILTIKNIEIGTKPLRSAPETLEQFLQQSSSKKKTLKRHWQNICHEYQISDEISLHEFLQFILKFNELFILNQKYSEIQSIVKNKSKKLRYLQKLLFRWFEITGSQKQINLENTQIILSEAQNVVRYKKDKESKLESILDHRLEIETNNKMKNEFDKKIHTLKLQWDEIFRKHKLSQKFSIDDSRVKPLFEKFHLLNSLLFLQNHLTSLKVLPFSNERLYEPICLWRVPFINLDADNSNSLVNCLKNLPKTSKHILYFRDSEISRLVKKMGMGQVIQYQINEIENNISDPTLLPKPATRQTIPTKKPWEQKAQTPEAQIPPRVKAVLDLLNGPSTKGRST